MRKYYKFKNCHLFGAWVVFQQLHLGEPIIFFSCIMYSVHLLSRSMYGPPMKCEATHYHYILCYQFILCFLQTVLTDCFICFSDLTAALCLNLSHHVRSFKMLNSVLQYCVLLQRHVLKLTAIIF